MLTPIRLLLLLAACVLSGESALLGSKKCTYGPSYWCSSLKGASECNAVQHCIQTVWEKRQLPEDNDDICTICKNMVQEARDQLVSNETQEDIRLVLDGSCRLIPIKLVANECVELANEFIPDFIDTLASEMNPQVVCATVGLCNSAPVDKLLLKYKEEHPDHMNAIIPVQTQPAQPSQQVQTPQPGDCESCKDFIKRTIRLVKTHSRAELMDRLLAICGRLGSVSDGCMALVEANFREIYSFLTEKLTPEGFCDLVEMCETRMHEGEFYQRPALPHSGDEVCDFCEAIVQHWRDVLTSNTTEVEFKEILEGLCRQTGGFRKNCLSLVDEYYAPLYNLLVSGIHPKEICESVGLCGENSVFRQQPPVWTLLKIQDQDVMPQVPLLPAIPVPQQPGHRMTGLDEAAAAHIDDAEEPQLARVHLSGSGIAVSHVGTNGIVGPAVGKSRVGDDNKCVMCEFVMQFLRKMLEEKSTREDIEIAVEKVCGLLPHSVSEECDDYVEAYGDMVIEMLVQDIDPAKICTMLHLCTDQPSVTRQKDDVSCVMCEYAMTQLDQMLGDHKTEEEIRQALDKLCGLLPKSVQDQCQVFVDTYTEQIINMLVHELSPDQICIELHLCKPKTPRLQELDASNQLPVSRLFVGVPPHASENTVSVPRETDPQSRVCVMCEFVMSEIDSLLKDNTTKSQIVEVVDFVCAHLPSTLMNDCIDFMDLYGDSIIDILVEQELNPKQVCQFLKLCKASVFTGVRATMDMNNCQICEAIVTQVDKELQTTNVQMIMEALVEKVCNILPAHVGNQCHDMVEVYGPYLANLLAEVMVPKTVCEELHICQKPAGQYSLIGGKKCTWGPSYWCQTKIHANACNAASHCQQTVWKMQTPSI